MGLTISKGADGREWGAGARRRLSGAFFELYASCPSFDEGAWWSAWSRFWEDLSDEFNPQTQRDRRSQERDQLDADHLGGGGGNAEGAGTGGQD